MANEHSQSQIETIIGNTISQDRERLKAVEVRGENAATKIDIERLKGEINSNHIELQKFISDEVSELEIKTLETIHWHMDHLVSYSLSIPYRNHYCPP